MIQFTCSVFRKNSIIIKNGREIMKNQDKSLWHFIQNTWKTRALFVFAVLWLWFMALATVFCPEIHILYLDEETFSQVFSETAIYWYILGLAIGVLGYITGLVWVLKKCSKNYNFNTHWIDLTIQRILYGIIFVIIIGIAIKAILSVNTVFPVASTVFTSISILSLVIAFIVSGLFVKQSLITEAHIKAKEIYNGKKRSAYYENKK